MYLAFDIFNVNLTVIIILILSSVSIGISCVSREDRQAF